MVNPEINLPTDVSKRQEFYWTKDKEMDFSFFLDIKFDDKYTKCIVSPMIINDLV